MKTIRHAWIVALFLCPGPVAFSQTSSQQAHAKKTSETAPSFAFEPLHNWKAAVLAGNKLPLSSFYSTNPPASAKTPQRQILDPSEEPALWSTLKAGGLDRLDVKILKAKTLQPGIMPLVLRLETLLKT